MFRSTSSRVMPMPLSRIVSVRASLSMRRSMLQLGVLGQQLRLAERREAQLVAGVGCVRDQLAQENLPVLYSEWIISEELPDLGLKRKRGRSVVDHRRPTHFDGWAGRLGATQLFSSASRRGPQAEPLREERERDDGPERDACARDACESRRPARGLERGLDADERRPAASNPITRYTRRNRWQSDAMTNTTSSSSSSHNRRTSTPAFLAKR